jgi:site-specific DNA recombinase
MKAAAIYCRVSTLDQARRGSSLCTQLEACRQQAQEQGYMIVKEMQDELSGTHLARPGLDELRDIAARGEIAAIFCYDPDRLTRNAAHAALLSEEFERRKVKLVFVNMPGHQSLHDGLTLNTRAVFAEFESEQMDERIRRGRKQTAKEGRVIMSACMPYGYKFIKGEGRLEIVEAEAEWVRKMYQWVAYEHCSLREVVRRLLAAGVPTQKGNIRWHRSTANNILTCTTYIGKWVYNKQAAAIPTNPTKPKNVGRKSSRIARPQSDWVEVDVPAIVPADLFEAVQAQLERNRQRYSSHNYYEFLLRNMLKCGRCGYALFGRGQIKGRKTKKVQRSYVCSGRFEHHRHLPPEERCPAPQRSADRLEALVWGEITRQMRNPQVNLTNPPDCEQAREQDRRRDDAELTALYALEEQATRELHKLLDLHMADLIDRDTLEERMSLVRRRQQAIEKAKFEAIQRIEQHDHITRSVEVARALREQLLGRGSSDFTIEEKRTLLAMLQVKIQVTDEEVLITSLLGTKALTLSLPHVKHP